jgi:AcrR family transcriptional regulator
MSPRPSNTNERRAEIVRAARQVIAERGFQELRVSDIARLAGTSPSAVHYHFRSRDEILDAVVSLAEDSFYTQIELARLAPERPAARLLALLDLGGRGNSPDSAVSWRVWLEIWARALHDRHTARTRELLDRRWRSTLAEAVRDGQTAGEFAPDADAELVALQLACLMDGLAIQFALGDPAVSGERMTELLVSTAQQALDCDLDGPAGGHPGAVPTTTRGKR